MEWIGHLIAAAWVVFIVAISIWYLWYENRKSKQPFDSAQRH